MKRYDIDIEGGDWMTAASLDITEQDDGEWVRWEDVKAAISSQQIAALTYDLADISHKLAEIPKEVLAVRHKLTLLSVAVRDERRENEVKPNSGQ